MQRLSDVEAWLATCSFKTLGKQDGKADQSSRKENRID